MKIEELEQALKQAKEAIETQKNSIEELKKQITSMEEASKENNTSYKAEIEKLKTDNANLLQSFQASLNNRQIGDKSNPTLDKILGGFKK